MMSSLMKCDRQQIPIHITTSYRYLRQGSVIAVHMPIWLDVLTIPRA